MRGKRVKQLRKAVHRKWSVLEGEKADFKVVFRRIKRGYVRGLIKVN